MPSELVPIIISLNYFLKYILFLDMGEGPHQRDQAPHGAARDVTGRDANYKR